MDGTALAGAEFLLGASLFLGTAAVVSVVLYRTARFRPEAMVVIAVAILTLVAVFAAVAAGSEALSTALVSLAGVGLGALAGAVRSLFGGGGDTPDQPPQSPPAPPAPPQTPDWQITEYPDETGSDKP